ncbi:phosphoglycerate dehydrogenase-like enzyme [Bradyrhizobium sp. LM2.7]
MRVLGVRRNKALSAEWFDSMHGMDELYSVLSRCDYVVLSCPITSETVDFFGKAELDAMKPSAFLVNVARGNLIQEKPLYEALTAGRLRGFATDVWWRYGIGKYFPTSSTAMSRLEIEKLPNVLGAIGQAHNADGVMERDFEWGVQSLVEFAAGRPITREVSLELEY